MRRDGARGEGGWFSPRFALAVAASFAAITALLVYMALQALRVFCLGLLVIVFLAIG